MSTAQYNKMIEMMSQVQAAVIGFSNRMDAHEAKSEREHAAILRLITDNEKKHEKTHKEMMSKVEQGHKEIIELIKDLAQTMSDDASETTAKTEARLDDHETRIHNVEKLAWSG